VPFGEVGRDRACRSHDLFSEAREWGRDPPGEGEGEAVQRGVAFLIRMQREDGTWDEPHFTGTGFPTDFMIRYHLYRHVFPLMALGRAREAAR